MGCNSPRKCTTGRISSSQWREAPAPESICKSPCVLELSLFFEIRTFIYGASIIDRFATKKTTRKTWKFQSVKWFPRGEHCERMGCSYYRWQFFPRLSRFNPIRGRFPYFWQRLKPPTVDIRTLDLGYNWQILEASTAPFGAPQLWTGHRIEILPCYIRDYFIKPW